MSSEELKIKVWAANQKAPLTRDQQIEFMKNARERRLARIERLKRGDYDIVD